MNFSGFEPTAKTINIVEAFVGRDASLTLPGATPLIDIDIGDSTPIVGDDNNLLDLNLGGDHIVSGNDNDVIDLGLGGSSD